MASVEVIQGPDKGRSFELTGGEVIIGRGSKTVCLTDGTISRSHARMIASNGRWIIEDLGSANGTYLNGVKLKKPTGVNRGDQIRLGSSLLVFGAGKNSPRAQVDVDEDGMLVDAAIVATIPSNEDSVIIPTPEAGAEAIGNLRILYGMISEVASILNIDRLLQHTLDKVFEFVTADRGYIMLMDENGKLELKASRIAGEQRPKQQIPISRTIINEVTTKEIGVLSSNAMSDKRFASGKSVHDFGIHSAICVPIKGRERILGVIHVDCSVSEHTYSTEQLRLLTAIGYQTGLAVENVRLYEAAVQSERLAAIGETVATLSHHIKNILQALGAGIDVVEMYLNRDNLAKAKDSWPIVQRNIGRINDLILNMLAFSKNREPLLESTNINHVLDECIELIGAKADERSIAVMSDLDDIPAIPADSTGLQHAFMNLLTNAIEAVANETGIITISSSYDSMNRKVIIKIIDNGSGIPADMLGQIFNPFWSSKGQKGTGLGLAVTRKIIEEHQGRIEVTSSPGEGTAFTITLPATSRDERDKSDTDTP